MLRKYIHRTIEVLLLLFVYNILPAQQLDLRKNADYFQKQKIAIDEWLEVTTQNDRGKLRLDSVSLFKNEIAIYFSVPSKKSWNSLLELSDSLYSKDFCQYFFRDLAFLLQPPNSLENIELDEYLTIWIMADDLMFSIFQNWDSGEVETLEIHKMGTVNDSMNVAFNDMHFFSTKDSLKLGPNAFMQLKVELTKNLQSFFEEEDQKSYLFFRGESEIEESKLRFNNQLRLRVKNIKGVIFSQADSWEFLCIDFFFRKEKDFLQLEYDIRAKYYDGGIFRPASNGTYKNKVDDVTELEKFNEEFKKIILNILKKNDE